MSRCLVVGANGFIGSHLVDGLVAQGHTVRAFSRFPNGRYMFEDNDRVEIISGDFMNSHDLEDAVSGCDYVFHFLSTTTPVTAEEDPFIDLDTNVRQTVELLKLCAKSGVKRVIYASSGGTVYGVDQNNLAHKETDQTRPVSPYGIGKVATEDYLRYFKVKHGLQYTVFRIANPYGERQQFWRKQGVIPIFLKHALAGEAVDVFGDGSMTRDYIYVKDMISMIIETLRNEPAYDTYNIGSGTGVTINELISAVEEVTHRTLARNVLPVPATFVDRTILDITRYRDEFGILPSTPLKSGIKATLEYIRTEIEKGSS